MLDKLKDLAKWNKIKIQVKKQQEQIFSALERRGNRVVVRGDKRIEKIEVDGVEEKDLRDLINEAMKDVEKKLDKKLRSTASELGIPDL